MHQMLSEVFAGCSKLKTVVMGDMIPWIYDKAFEGCPLEKIIVETPNPPAMDSLGDGKASDVFGTYGLGNIHVYTYPDYVAHYEKAEDDKMGSVTGGRSFLKDSEISIKAEAFEGFIFLQWNDGDTNAERTVKVTEDKTYIASFAEDTQAVEEVQSDKIQGTKVIENGVLYLMYNGQMYNVQGQKVER